jgi:uncharacterized transporter YbjL
MQGVDANKLTILKPKPMETLQTIQNFITENERLITICVLVFILIVQIALMVDRHYLKKDVKAHRADRNKYADKYLKKIDEKIEEMKAHEKTLQELAELKKENAHILKVNTGMCLRKAAISKEIIDDLNLRKTAIGEALRVVRENNLLKNNHPDILKMIADEIYSYLTSKQ